MGEFSKNQELLLGVGNVEKWVESDLLWPTSLVAQSPPWPAPGLH